MISPSPLTVVKSYQEAESQLGLNELSDTDRVSFAATISGIHNYVSIASVESDKDPGRSENIRLKQIQIASPVEEESIKTILDIFQTLSTKGLEIANFNFTGFAVDDDLKKAETIVDKDLSGKGEGLYLLTNVDLRDHRGQTPFSPDSNHLINVFKELSQRALGRKVILVDSRHPSNHPYVIGTGKTLTININNDTVRAMIGALCSPNDKQIRSMVDSGALGVVGGFINGIGFNFGLGKGYSKNLIRFDKVVNEELGHRLLMEDLIGPLDRVLGASQEPITAELCFAGGRGGEDDFDLLKGVRRELAIFFKTLEAKAQVGDIDSYLSEIAAYYNQVAQEYQLGFDINGCDIRESQVFKAFEASKSQGGFVIPSKRVIIDWAADKEQEQDIDKFAKAILVSSFARQGEYIARAYKDEISNMKVLAVAGNYAIDILNRIQAARNAFIKPLRAINPEIHLFAHALGGNNGLGDLAVDSLSLVSGLVPNHSKSADSTAERASGRGVFARFWAWIKSLVS